MTNTILTHLFLTLSIYYGIQSVWRIVFDIYTKAVRADNVTAARILSFAICYSIYHLLITIPK